MFCSSDTFNIDTILVANQAKWALIVMFNQNVHYLYRSLEAPRKYFNTKNTELKYQARESNSNGKYAVR